MSSIIKNFRDGTVTFKDGTGTPLEAEAVVDQGNLTVSGLSPQQTETQAYYSRGALAGLRQGNFKPFSWSMSLHFTEFTISASGNLLDMIFGTGTTYGSRVSTSVALGDVITFDIDVDVEGTDLGDSADHQIALTDCSVDSVDFAEGDPNTLNLSGTGYGTATRA